MILNIIIILFGLVAIFFWIISLQEKRQYKIIYLQMFANLFYAIEYLLLGVLSASAMNFVSTVRCYLFYTKKKERRKVPKVWLIGFISLLLILGIITYNGYLSLIPIIITMFYTIASYLKKSKWIRIVVLLAAFIWIYYNYIVGAYVTIIGNVLEIASSSISLIRYRKESE